MIGDERAFAKRSQVLKDLIERHRRPGGRADELSPPSEGLPAPAGPVAKPYSMVTAGLESLAPGGYSPSDIDQSTARKVLEVLMKEDFERGTKARKGSWMDNVFRNIEVNPKNWGRYWEPPQSSRVYDERPAWRRYLLDE